MQDIDLTLLKQKNIKGLILDIDNTLVPTHVKEADDNIIQWLERVKELDFKVCIVSNASQTRVIKFNEKLKIFAIHRAFKPGSKAFYKAARLMDLDNGEIAVVGDQVFTDIYGGNKAGMFTVLTKPIHPDEFIFVKFKRIFEKFVLSLYNKKTENERKDTD